jgi:hypothetical protein
MDPSEVGILARKPDVLQVVDVFEVVRGIDSFHRDVGEGFKRLLAL